MLCCAAAPCNLGYISRLLGCTVRCCAWLGPLCCTTLCWAVPCKVPFKVPCKVYELCLLCACTAASSRLHCKSITPGDVCCRSTGRRSGASGATGHGRSTASKTRRQQSELKGCGLRLHCKPSVATMPGAVSSAAALKASCSPNECVIVSRSNRSCRLISNRSKEVVYEHLSLTTEANLWHL